MTLNLNSLEIFFNRYRNISKFIVAFSGGLDSTVLLHVMHALDLPLQVVHTNHNLVEGSNVWERHCKDVCSKMGISLSVTQLHIEKLPQKSLEELARNARYQSLFQFVSKTDVLVTAHHKNDLAETLLLQLMRGSGPSGLAAMQQDTQTKYGQQLRPLLEYSRDELFEYAKQYSLKWIDDPTNQSTEFDRNFLRLEILPRLMERWPGTLETLSRVAELQSSTLKCLHDLAEIDLNDAKTGTTDVLNVEALQKLGPARLQNALRRWITAHAMRVPSKKRLEQITKDIVYKQKLETTPVQSWEDGEIRRYHDRLYIMVPLSKHDPEQVIQWNLNQSIYIESLDMKLSRSDLEQNSIQVPEGAESLTIRFRQGGERLKPIGNKQHRSLKNLFQEAEIPPWQRDRIPLIYYQDQLISVLGHWNV